MTCGCCWKAFTTSRAQGALIKQDPVDFKIGRVEMAQKSGMTRPATTGRIWSPSKKARGADDEEMIPVPESVGDLEEEGATREVLNGGDEGMKGGKGVVGKEMGEAGNVMMSMLEAHVEHPQKKVQDMQKEIQGLKKRSRR